MWPDSPSPKYTFSKIHKACAGRRPTLLFAQPVSAVKAAPCPAHGTSTAFRAPPLPLQRTCMPPLLHPFPNAPMHTCVFVPTPLAWLACLIDQWLERASAWQCADSTSTPACTMCCMKAPMGTPADGYRSLPRVPSSTLLYHTLALYEGRGSPSQSLAYTSRAPGCLAGRVPLGPCPLALLCLRPHASPPLPSRPARFPLPLFGPPRLLRMDACTCTPFLNQMLLLGGSPASPSPQ